MKFYVVEHCCGGFSVSTKPEGAGILLDVEHENTRESAQLACDTANKAIEIFNHPPNHDV